VLLGRTLRRGCKERAKEAGEQMLALLDEDQVLDPSCVDCAAGAWDGYSSATASAGCFGHVAAMQCRAEVPCDDAAAREAENHQMAQITVEALAASNPASPVAVEVHHVVGLLERFQRNNFGVWNELLVPVAASVFPFGALLNHACEYNCVLSYDLAGRRQIIRAARDLEAGEELCHTYVDLMQATTERKAGLLATYGFECQCNRCESPTYHQLDLALGSTPQDMAAAAEADLLYERCTSVDADPAEACKGIQRCIELRRSALPKLSVPVVRAYSALHTLALEAGEFELALSSSAELIEAYGAVYGAKHPLTGLQHYTQGNLLCELEQPEAGMVALTHALACLVVSHGKESQFVQGLVRYMQNRCR